MESEEIKLNILWLSRQPSLTLCMYDLRLSLTKITNVTFLPSNQNYNLKRENIVKDNDVIVIGPYIGDYECWRELGQINIPKVMFSADPATTMAQQVYFAKKNKINLILSLYKEWIPFLEKKTSIRTIWLPLSIDVSRVNKATVNCKKTNSVVWSPETSEFYPIRFEMTKNNVLKREKIQSFIIGDQKNRLSDEGYLRRLSNSRIVVFDGTIWNYALAKYFEVMACKSLVMATKPFDAEDLHFIPDENFVEVTTENYMNKLKYYLTYPKKADEIATKGYDVICKYHDSSIRARQLLNILDEYWN